MKTLDSQVIKKPRMGIKQNPEARKKIQQVEDAMIKAGFAQRKTGELDKQEGYEIVNSFADGMYIRECRVPKGWIFTSELHRFDHPFFLMKGRLRICSEDADVIMQAPHYGITLKGTKRLVYIEEDVVWITCHATEETDINKILEEITAEYSDFELEEKI